MTIESRLVDGIIYTELSGEIDYDSVMQQMDFILSLKDKILNRYELHDHTNTDSINLSFEEINDVAERSQRTKNIFQNSFLAVYAPNDLTFGIARMFKTFFDLEKHTMNVSIFRNKEEAIKFLQTNKNRYGWQREPESAETPYSNARYGTDIFCISKRVCRAWHRTSEVKVLVPGFRGAKG